MIDNCWHNYCELQFEYWRCKMRGIDRRSLQSFGKQWKYWDCITVYHDTDISSPDSRSLELAQLSNWWDKELGNCRNLALSNWTLVVEELIILDHWFVLKRDSFDLSFGIIQPLKELLPCVWMWSNISTLSPASTISLEAAIKSFLLSVIVSLTTQPLDMNSLSLEFRHFIRRFWNHILTWKNAKCLLASVYVLIIEIFSVWNFFININSIIRTPSYALTMN